MDKNLVIDGSSYKGKADKDFYNWNMVEPWNCSKEAQISAVSGRIIEQKVEFLGKEELKRVKSEGIKRKLMGVKFDIEKISLAGSLDLTDDQNNIVGELRSACYSPHFKKSDWYCHDEKITLECRPEGKSKHK